MAGALARRYRLERDRWPSTGARGGWRAVRSPTPRHRSTVTGVASGVCVRPPDEGGANRGLRL